MVFKQAAALRVSKTRVMKATNPSKIATTAQFKRHKGLSTHCCNITVLLLEWLWMRFSALQDMRHHWESSQREAEELQGCQVFAMAAALQALSTRLEW